MLNKNINENGAYWEKQGFGTTNWPECGEIDILEHWGKNQNRIQSAVHTSSSYGHEVLNVGGQKIANASTKFHLYTLNWTKDKMVFSIDGVEHYRYNPSIKNAATWPFDTDQYLLLNIAIEPDIDASFTESSMEIDYIRIFQ
jgi:beta-glucanase (GH16 family)